MDINKIKECTLLFKKIYGDFDVQPLPDIELGKIPTFLGATAELNIKTGKVTLTSLLFKDKDVSLKDKNDNKT